MYFLIGIFLLSVHANIVDTHPTRHTIHTGDKSIGRGQDKITDRQSEARSLEFLAEFESGDAEGRLAQIFLKRSGAQDCEHSAPRHPLFHHV